MSENINFTSNFTLTKLDGDDVNRIIFDVTPADGLIISKDIPGGSTVTTTINGDLVVTGDFRVTGDTVINTNTKLSVTNKNVLMNVPSEPTNPSGTSTLFGDVVSVAVVSNPGVSFPPSTVINVVFHAPPSGGTTATGTVTSDAFGNIPHGAAVTIVNSGSGYVVAPEFTYGSASNIPSRPIVYEDTAGTIVIRDWHDGTQPPVGILWNESRYAWDLNQGIAQDIYTTNVASPSVLPNNPRLMNIGDADLTAGSDAVNVNVLKSWGLGDLVDVNTISPSIGEVLIYRYNTTTLANEWQNSQISFGDIAGITLPPTTSGFFYWEHDAMPNPAVAFVSTIDYSKLSSMSVVAESGFGDLRYLGDVSLPPAAVSSTPNGINNSLVNSDVLAWDYSAGKWTNKQISALGTISSIQDAATSPTSSITTTSSGIAIHTTSGDVSITSVNDSIILTAGASVSVTATDISLISQNPILVATDTATERNAILYSEGDFTIMSSTGNVIIQDIKFPSVDAATPVDSVLVLKKTLPSDGEGWLEWSTPSGGGVASTTEIKNHQTAPTTKVSTSFYPDTVFIEAPDLGGMGVDGVTPVTNNIGVYIQPGDQRSVTVAGTGDANINATEGLIISASNTLSLVSGNQVKIQDYEFPTQLTSRGVGDVLALDPNDATKKQLIFKHIKELPADSDGVLHNIAGALSWKKMPTVLSSTVHITVGPSITDNFQTLNAALAFVVANYLPMYYHGSPMRVNITLSYGYSMVEQVLVDAINLSWVTVNGNEPVYLVNPAVFVALSPTVYKPAFAAINGGRLPVIAAKFTMMPAPISFQVGVMVMGAGSSAGISSSSGFTAFAINLYATDGATITADGADLSSGTAATEYGVLAEKSSNISVRGCNVTSCEYGVVAVGNSRIDCSESIITGSSQFGVYASKGSDITAIDVDARNGISSDSIYDFVVNYGSRISANDGFGGAGQHDGNVTFAINWSENSPNGIIYQ